VILDLLGDSPKHGYEIIKLLEERTGGRYSPSPGTLYPTLQYLEDEGMVSSDQSEGRRVYQLTDAGRTEMQEHSGHAKGFWSRFGEQMPSGSALHEISFVKDALNDLNRTVGTALRGAMFLGGSNSDTIRKVRQVLERSQNEIREIIAKAANEAGPTSESPRAEGEPDAPDASEYNSETRSL